MVGHREFFTRLQQRVRPREPSTPLLSVVVPIHDVEPYLAECLDSILAQPLDDIEVVLVDDGSTDSSGVIARRYAEKHAHFRLISQENRGLGAARNVGVSHALGRYLTFLDSDDPLPADAWSAMIGSLERSGSDLACGALARAHGRDAGRPRSMTRRMRENHRVRKVGITVREQPLILADVFACNKIFRRSFWDRAALAFPSGVRYEDQPTLTRAFLAAERFDVLPETVYLWRVRDDGSSITQRRHDIADLRDRLVTKRWSLESVLHQAPDLLDVFLADVLPADMFAYFRSVPGCSDEYWNLLVEMIREFWSDSTMPFHETVAPVQHRLLGWFVTHDRRDEVLRILEFLESAGGEVPVERRGETLVALLPGVDHNAMPAACYTLADHETRLVARVLEARWEETRLALRGTAWIRSVPDTDRTAAIRARLIADDGRVLDVEVCPAHEPGAGSNPSADEPGSAFTAVVEVGSLLGSGPTTWRLEFSMSVGGLQRSGPVSGYVRRNVDRSWRRIPSTGQVPRQVRLRDDQGGLALDVRPQQSPDLKS